MADEPVSLQFEEEEPQRLDHFLVTKFPEYSRSRLQALIQEGCVLVDGRVARKSGQLLENGALVSVELPPIKSAGLLAEAIPLDVVYEDQNVLIVNKPAGMVVHPSAGHAAGTLVNAALAHAPEMQGIGGEHRPGVVHRLDKETSGLILLAKNDQTHRWLQDQFRRRSVGKLYQALVDGRPPAPAGVVDAPIGRDLRDRNKMAVVSQGKGRPAQTEFKIVESFSAHTLLETRPLTGRTHQIRVHLAFLGCPVVGDRTYGRKPRTLPMTRHFLHAAQIGICLPGEADPRIFSAPLPEELVSLLELLRSTRTIE